MGAGREQRWYGAPGDWGYQLGFRQGGCSIFKLDNDGSLMKSFFFFFLIKEAWYLRGCTPRNTTGQRREDRKRGQWQYQGLSASPPLP